VPLLPRRGERDHPGGLPRVSIARGTIYTTFAPCLMCTKMIINSGLHEVVYNMDYPLNDVTFKLFKDAGVVCRKLKVE
jgi:dCMP deaminase